MAHLAQIIYEHIMFLQWLIISWEDYLRPHIIFSLQAHPSLKSSKLAETETHTHTHTQGKEYITENVRAVRATMI